MSCFGWSSVQLICACLPHRDYNTHMQPSASPLLNQIHIGGIKPGTQKSHQSRERVRLRCAALSRLETSKPHFPFFSPLSWKCSVCGTSCSVDIHRCRHSAVKWVCLCSQPLLLALSLTFPDLSLWPKYIKAGIHWKVKVYRTIFVVGSRSITFIAQSLSGRFYQCVALWSLKCPIWFNIL